MSRNGFRRVNNPGFFWSSAAGTAVGDKSGVMFASEEVLGGVGGTFVALEMVTGCAGAIFGGGSSMTVTIVTGRFAGGGGIFVTATT